MNVALSNATPLSSPARPDAASATARIVPGSDGGGIDAPVQSGGEAGDAFGRLLSRQLIALDRAGPGVASLQPGDPDTGVADAGRPNDTIARKTGRVTGFGAVIDDSLTGDPAASTSTKPSDDATDGLAATGNTGAHDDAAASDLAAQLALVSQWAGAARPTATDGLDVRNRLETVTATSSSQRAPAAIAGFEETANDGRPISFAAARAARDEVPVTSAGDARALSDTVKEHESTLRDDATARISADRSALADAVSKAAAGGHAAFEAIASTGAFVQQSVAPPPVVATPIGSVAIDPPVWMLHEPVGTPAWSREVGQATLRLAGTDLQTASLQLNPEHLGPVDVQLRIDNGVAHLSFTAAHADTRQAIESSRPALDQVFADQGLKIGDCAVGDSSTPRRGDADATSAGQSQRDGSDRRGGDAGIAEAAGAVTNAIATRVKALGLVDTFA